ncbi:MAG: ATP-binding cassette domain-containing protein [Firmicutes bacterium]|nr:ATP-binding cassette domain-containing protein [Bacillota bacterium]
MNIKFVNVSKKFDDKIILNNFSDEVKSGDFCCVFGESGSGKTTLLNMVGFLEPYEGKILYDNDEVTTTKEKQRLLSSYIGFLFQDYGLVENDTVYNNFSLIKNFNKIKHKGLVEECLKKVGLGGFVNRKVYALSGGEQQRVAIAKLLFKQPKLILADEPTASLDSENKAQIIQLLLTLNNSGATVLLVTHDQEFKEYANQVIELLL